MLLAWMSLRRHQRKSFHVILRYLFQILATPLRNDEFVLYPLQWMTEEYLLILSWNKLFSGHFLRLLFMARQLFFFCYINYRGQTVRKQIVCFSFFFKLDKAGLFEGSFFLMARGEGGQFEHPLYISRKTDPILIWFETVVK